MKKSTKDHANNNRVRFPGYWLFHCHIEFHAEIGMSLIFKVGEHEEMPPVPPNFPRCGDWSMNYNVADDPVDKPKSDDANSTVTTAAEEPPAIVKIAMAIDHLVKLLPEFVKELRPKTSSASGLCATLLPVMLASFVSFVTCLR